MISISACLPLFSYLGRGEGDGEKYIGVVFAWLFRADNWKCRWVKTDMGQDLADELGAPEPPVSVEESIEGVVKQVCFSMPLCKYAFILGCTELTRDALSLRLMT